MFTEDNQVDIPVITENEYNMLIEKCKEAAVKTLLLLEDELREWQNDLASCVPKHIPKYTAAQAKYRVFNGFELAVCWDLYEQGVHLAGVDYCCPPVVLSVR